MWALSRQAMELVEKQAQNLLGISTKTLAETAGYAIARWVEANYPLFKHQPVCILAGPGNNGADALIAARYLKLFGADLQVITVGQPRSLCSDTLWQFTQVQGAKTTSFKGNLPDAQIYLDGLFGFGFRGPLEEPFQALINLLNNKTGATVISIDVPSGICANSGDASPIAVKADVTLTLGLPKMGLYLAEGYDHSGSIITLPLSLPNWLIDRNVELKAQLIDKTTSQSISIERKDHKFRNGRLFAYVGSKQMPGAAYLSLSGALASGCGYIDCYTTADKNAFIHQLPEVIWHKETDNVAHNTTAMLIGCGIGRKRSPEKLLKEYQGPIVIDGDGLWWLSQIKPEHFSKEKRSKWLLTPHHGELERLYGKPIMPCERIAAIQAVAEKWSCTILAKGFASIVVTTDELWINTTGSKAVATAGAGDVLAGICAGLMTQGLLPKQAAIKGIYCAGVACDTANKRALRPSELLQYIRI